MQVDMAWIAEQQSVTFNLDAWQVEIEILALQNNLQFKAHLGAKKKMVLYGHRQIQSCMHSNYESLFSSSHLC